jgi:hypothetical protein
MAETSALTHEGIPTLLEKIADIAIESGQLVKAEPIPEDVVKRKRCC